MICVEENKLKEIISDQLSSKLKPILEYVQEIPKINLRLDSIEARIDDVEAMLRMHEEDIRFLYTKIK